MEELVMGRKDNPMDEQWMQAKWRPDDDDEGVSVIPAEEAALREPTERAPYIAPEATVARLRHATNADEHHNIGVSSLRTALEAAVNFLSVPRTGAKSWAADLSYRDEILPHIRVAVEEVNQALNIIDIHEQ
jgi:hypothetical protein